MAEFVGTKMVALPGKRNPSSAMAVFRVSAKDDSPAVRRAARTLS